MKIRFIKCYLLTLCLVLVTTDCSAQNQPKVAWWLSIELDANHKELNNIPLIEYNETWLAASFIDNDIIQKKISGSDYKYLTESAFQFTVQHDLNKNGITEIFKVGVYKDKANTRGIFLAIFENGQLIKVLNDSSHQNFSALLLQNNQLNWYRCMECGEFEQLVWTGSGYFLE